jgi:hypothetical protein
MLELQTTSNWNVCGVCSILAAWALSAMPADHAPQSGWLLVGPTKRVNCLLLVGPTLQSLAGKYLSHVEEKGPGGSE